MTAAGTKTYDQDSEDLGRWLLKQQARKTLMKVELRQKKVREFYAGTKSVLGPTPDIKDGLFVDIPAQRYRYVPVINESKYGPSSELKRAAKYRVINCCRNKIGKSVDPEVWYSQKSSRASLHKVQLCGSVWTCPTCSRKINIKRQAAIAKAYELILDKAPMVTDLDGAQVRQGDAIMVTFTVRHGAGDELAHLLGAMKSADRRMQQLRPYRALTGKDSGYIGRIAATEITHGASGWHPHSHQLWFFGKHLSDVEIECIRAILFQQWKLACVANGLPEPLEFAPDQATGRVAGRGLGVDVRRALTAAEYMTKTGTLKKEGDVPTRKWSAEKELASTHVKRARKAGRSPFQLLFDSGEGDEKAGNLFRIYAEATLGRHQLEFSKGLRKYLEGLDYKEHLISDEDLAMSLEEDNSKLLGAIDEHDFEILTSAEEYGETNPFGRLLYICKHEGFDAAMRWLRDLRRRPRSAKGTHHGTKKTHLSNHGTSLTVAHDEAFA